MCLVYSNELPGRCVCVQKEQAGVFVQVEWSGSFVQFGFLASDFAVVMALTFV